MGVLKFILPSDPLLAVSYLLGDHSNILNWCSSLTTYGHISSSSDVTTDGKVKRASVIPMLCTTYNEALRY